MTCIYQRPTTNLYVSKSCYHHICNSLFTDRFAQWLEAQSLQGTAHFLYAKEKKKKNLTPLTSELAKLELQILSVSLHPCC